MASDLRKRWDRGRPRWADLPVLSPTDPPGPTAQAGGHVPVLAEQEHAGGQRVASPSPMRVRRGGLGEMARRRGFGEIERRVSAKGEVTHRARYAMPDGTRFSRTFATKLDAEGWLSTERSLMDRDQWTPPP